MRRRTMQIPLLFILLLLGGLACHPPITSTPAGSIEPYTPAQLKALEKWELRNRVEQQQRISPKDTEIFIDRQLRHLFPQPLVRYRASCQSGFDCTP